MDTCYCCRLSRIGVHHYCQHMPCNYKDILLYPFHLDNPSRCSSKRKSCLTCLRLCSIFIHLNTRCQTCTVAYCLNPTVFRTFYCYIDSRTRQLSLNKGCYHRTCLLIFVLRYLRVIIEILFGVRIIFRLSRQSKHHSFVLLRLCSLLKPAYDRSQNLPRVLDIVAQVFFGFRRVHEPIETAVLDCLFFHYLNVEPRQQSYREQRKVVGQL